MDFLRFFFLLCVLSWTCFHVLKSILQPRRRPNFPPGPPPLPVIGNILQLGENPHQSLAKLAKTYGPLMHLKFGSVDTIVVSSPALAKEVLQKHDRVLSGRPHPDVTSAYGHNKVSLAWLPIDGRWRVLRKICKDQMFSLQRIDSSQGLRREKLRKLLDYVQECCNSCRLLDIADAAFSMSLNLISASLFSVEFAQIGSDSSHDFKGIVRGLLQLAGTPNLADYFPLLKPIDPQGLKRKSVSNFGKLLRIFDDIIDQRLKSESRAYTNYERKNDLLEALLDISRRNESELNRNDILHLLMDLFIAGTDTTANTVEWVMAELIHSPGKMSKARKELQTIIGGKGQVQESDISRLPYLQAVVKETFRLHPPGPLLIPHKAEADAEINGYIVPRNAQILVNVWAIGRDSSIWSNPDVFEPERFLDSKIDIRGQDFELIPFGSGRRICPGLPLAYRIVHVLVASLIHNFDWKLEGGITPDELDMKEKFQLTLQKAVPLKAVPVKL
ncbi:cytochrome [Sesamum angolense]|uniref:Cytochrome n=1 Tax=Sesamum angolense TaxID=2727404 RepID=A0AAE2C2L6_9LAMI|nr:cytochrome [Sesamum angolense]